MDAVRPLLPSRRFLHWKDLARAAAAIALSVVFASLFLVPEFALAGGPGTSADLGLRKALSRVRNFITGDVVQIGATIAMVAVLGGIIVRSQRGESISSLIGVGVALVLISNIENVIDLLGISSSASMASMAPAAESLLMVTP